MLQLTKVSCFSRSRTSTILTIFLINYQGFYLIKSNAMPFWFSLVWRVSRLAMWKSFVFPYNTTISEISYGDGKFLVQFKGLVSNFLSFRVTNRRPIVESNRQGAALLTWHFVYLRLPLFPPGFNSRILFLLKGFFRLVAIGFGANDYGVSTEMCRIEAFYSSLAIGTFNFFSRNEF